MFSLGESILHPIRISYMDLKYITQVLLHIKLELN